MTSIFASQKFRMLTASLLIAASAAFASPSRAEEGIQIPAPAMSEPVETGATETAVFAGGCFWGVQAVFQHTNGVKNAVSGYAGGGKNTAVYEVVGSGATGHAEAVKITYDPKKISYGKLLQVYFSVAHDPTQLNRQGPDRGTQYRSAIFPVNEQQAKAAKEYISQLDGAKTFKKPIATKIEPDHEFYAAENYHQDYLTLHPNQPYIVFNDKPKIVNLKRIFPDLYREKPALVSEAKLSN